MANKSINHSFEQYNIGWHNFYSLNFDFMILYTIAIKIVGSYSPIEPTMFALLSNGPKFSVTIFIVPSGVVTCQEGMDYWKDWNTLLRQFLGKITHMWATMDHRSGFRLLYACLLSWSMASLDVRGVNEDEKCVFTVVYQYHRRWLMHHSCHISTPLYHRVIVL